MARARRGKYAGLTDTLPKIPLVDPSRREIVELVQQSILKPEVGHLLATQTLDIDSTLKQIDAAVHNINAAIVGGTEGRRWASEFARLYALVRHVRERMGTMDSLLSVTEEAMKVLMVEQMEIEGTSSIRLADGQLISTYPEPYAKVVDKDLFREWCIQEGLMRQLALPWATTNSLLKQRLIAGEPEPPGVEACAIDRISLRKE